MTRFHYLKIHFVALLIGGLLLAACAGTGGQPLEPTRPEPTETPAGEPTDMPDSDELLIRPAMVDAININIMESFPLQVSVTAVGQLNDGCTTIHDATVTREGDTFRVELTTQRPVDAICTQALVPFSENITLDVLGLPAGDYTVEVNGVTDTFTFTQDNSLSGE